jgi:hypothetical protein
MPQLLATLLIVLLLLAALPFLLLWWVTPSAQARRVVALRCPGLYGLIVRPALGRGAGAHPRADADRLVARR